MYLFFATSVAAQDLPRYDTLFAGRITILADDGQSVGLYRDGSVRLTGHVRSDSSSFSTSDSTIDVNKNYVDTKTRTAFGFASLFDSTSQNLTSGSWVQVRFANVKDTLPGWNTTPAEGSQYQTLRGKNTGRYSGVLRLTLHNGQILNSANFEVKITKNDTLITGGHAHADADAGDDISLTLPFYFTVSVGDTTIWNASGVGGGFFNFKAFVFVDQTSCTITNATNATATGFNPTSAFVMIKWEGY